MSLLKDDFKKRNEWKHYRSSAVFPAILDDENDTIIVFQDYWKWKSNINEKKLILTIRNKDGEHLGCEYLKINNHNEISLKKTFDIDNMLGSVEVEIISLENLKFPFPAIQIAIKNETSNSYGMVHSAGRKLNPNEDVKESNWNETNFKCKLNNQFTPFVHIFYGSDISNVSDKIKFEFVNFNNQIIFDKSIFNKPHSNGSNIIFINEILSKSEKALLFNKNFFTKVYFKINGIFGRLIVGNYDYRSNSYFLTHTFKDIQPNNKDFIEPNKEFKYTSFCPLISKKPLSVEAKVYPTTSESKSSLILKEALISEKIVMDEKERKEIKTGGSKAKVWISKCNNDKLKVWYSKTSFPSRLAVNYEYKLDGSNYETDIATGFKSNVYPPKFSHWGHGINDDGWNTHIYFRNISHNPQETKDSSLEFYLILDADEKKINYNVPAETGICVDISKIKFKSIKNSFFSWRAIASQGTIESFWISFNIKTTMIVGCHGF